MFSAEQYLHLPSCIGCSLPTHPTLASSKTAASELHRTRCIQQCTKPFDSLEFCSQICPVQQREDKKIITISPKEMPGVLDLPVIYCSPIGTVRYATVKYKPQNLYLATSHVLSRITKNLHLQQNFSSIFTKSRLL